MYNYVLLKMCRSWDRKSILAWKLVVLLARRVLIDIVHGVYSKMVYVRFAPDTV